MPCYFPLHAYKGKSNEADKIKITFRRSDSWRGVKLDLPCGQCVGCRLERSRQWAVRCMHEASLHDDNSFITLTYDDEHLPADRSLHLEDFQLFMKRLRRSLHGKRVRFYHCGEYGEDLGRPHYHALLFGHDFADKKFFSSRGGNNVFVSATLSRLWPFGYSVIGAVTFDSAAYVARYVMKKVTGEKADDHYNGRRPEYVTMSRRPGIGRGWYDKYRFDVYPLDRVVVNGKETRPPRFYDRLLEKDDRSCLEQIKIKREEKSGNHYVDDVLSDGTKIRVSDTCGARLLVKEEVKRAELSTLRRPLEEV